ncbi:uncharacterized protein LOC129409261 [Boleophthalmus pectinirostris]|uniref:uncharacterized protein LOC129409261 n=1 Tax=Boleophthalmus pectinirostris TaxID=150288 RepID=UPI00242EE178|nr:uncharacterized protein LOC129409261 [Boleophthalmus pectinirostris]XP_055010847.1 uncharacterized protein LOC129409261 [Boleophthalmus pectinirostris]
MEHTIEEYCAHAASVMAKLNHQRTQAQFCDCVIRKGLGQVYPVHRCILAASSPVLASILDSSGILVELEAPCLSDHILGHLLDYIYTGTLPHLDYNLYSYLLAAAQYLEMDELQLTIRTKVADTLEYYNTTDEAHSFSLLPPGIDCSKNPSESPLHYWNDGIYMKSRPDAFNCVISETDQTSCITGSSGQKQQLSTVCQDREKSQSSGVIKPETGQGNKREEARLHPFVSTQVQENKPTQVERIQDVCKHDNVKAEEIQSNSGEDKSHNSSCSSTSVIRHSSRVIRAHEENVAIKLPHDTEPCTGQTLTGRTYCAIAEDTKTSDLHSNYQDVEYIPASDSSCSVNLLGNNNPDTFQKDSNKNEQYGISTKNTTCISQVHNAAKLVDEISDARIRFREKRIYAKRKLKEENGDKSSKSAKTDMACSASAVTETCTDYFFTSEQNAQLENKNTTTTLYRSLSEPPEGNTCLPAYTDTQRSYSGHLFYHCESMTSHISFAPNFSPTFSDNDPTTTLDEGQVVLLDISSKSSDTLVSYKRTSETHAAGGLNEIKKDHDKTQNSKGANNSITYCHEEGVDILTSCTSACGKKCAHNSTVSMSVSHLIPSPSMQPNVSDLLSPVQQTFQCSLCERSFSQRGSLNRHVRSHLGVRPFPCPQCPMSFSRQYRVVEHMRVHQRSALGMDFPKPPASSV